MAHDREHGLRHQLDLRILQFVDELQTSPELRAKGEQLTRDLLERPELRAWIASAWTDAKAQLRAQSDDPDSALRQQVAAAITAGGERLLAEPALVAKIDDAAEAAARYVVEHFGGEINQLVATTIARWDGEETSERLELLLGPDLQFIRINGTVVGGAAGLRSPQRRAGARVIRAARPSDYPQAGRRRAASGSAVPRRRHARDRRRRAVPPGRPGRRATRCSSPPTTTDEPVGYAMVELVDGHAHLEQISVIPDHGGQGVGTQLLDAVAGWAKAQGHAEVTLTTFKDVPFNAPLYAKRGYEIVPEEEWTDDLRGVVAREAEHGLDVTPARRDAPAPLVAEALHGLGVALPVLVDLHLELEVGALGELLAHRDADLLEHLALLADHDPLLAARAPRGSRSG